MGVSGGLDSTGCFAVRAMKLSNVRFRILRRTMPGFGTTERTHSNSEKLCSLLGVTFKEVNITAVEQHFRISVRTPCLDVTYENSQARERAGALDIAVNRAEWL
ncbi:MAG: hypothetical protein ACLR56_06225 [Oscillospiraceae bacterium]